MKLRDEIILVRLYEISVVDPHPFGSGVRCIADRANQGYDGQTHPTGSDVSGHESRCQFILIALLAASSGSV